MRKLTGNINVEDINVTVAIFYMLFMIAVLLLLILYFAVLK